MPLVPLLPRNKADSGSSSAGAARCSVSRSGLCVFQLCIDQLVAMEAATTRSSYGMMFERIVLKLPTPVAGKNSAGRLQSVCSCDTRSETSRGAVVSHRQITSMYPGAVLQPIHVEKRLQRIRVHPFPVTASSALRVTVMLQPPSSPRVNSTNSHPHSHLWTI